MPHDHATLAADGLFTAAGHWFLHILPFEFTRYSIVAGGMFLLVWVLLARPLAGRKIRTARPTARQMAIETLASFRTSAVFAISGVVSILGSQAGILKSYDDPALYGWGYFWLSLAGIIVLHDAWFYWTHRLIHDPRLFRRVHRLHHKSFNPSPFTAYSFDLGEAAINAAFVPLLLLIVPVSQLAIFIFLAHMIVRNVMGHTGYELFPARRDGRPLFDWMTNVTHHDLHHSQAGWNYGLYFSWWDRLMKTEHPLYHEKFAEAVRKPLDGSAVRAMRPSAKGAATVLIALASFAVFAINAKALAVEAAPFASVTGLWATEGHGAHVVLSACPEAPQELCGRLVWAWDPAIAAKGSALPMLGGFVWNGESFAGGWLRNPEDGRTYRGKISLGDDGALRLKGCALVFCQAQVWRRIEDIPGCVAAPAAVVVEKATEQL